MHPREIVVRLAAIRRVGHRFADQRTLDENDLAVGVATGGAMSNTLMIGLLAALELWAILKLAQS